MTQEELYKMYAYATLEEMAVNCKRSPDFIDDLYFGLVGFPEGHPFSEFRKVHGMPEYNPDNIDTILFELSDLFREEYYPYDKFLKEEITEKQVTELLLEKLKFSAEERLLNIRKIMVENYDWSKDFLNYK